MKKKQVNANILALLLALLLAGCITSANLYEGPELPQSKIAIVTMSTSLAVGSVDGIKGHGTMILKMLPGYHTITLFYGDGYRRSTSPQTITFTAKAGKSYYINGNATGMGWNPSIVELPENR